MRHLIDTYIEADEPRKISPFDDLSLVELIVKTGIADAIAVQLGSLKGNKDGIAETIENNVRSKIIKEHLNDPAFYAKISALLNQIIADRKAKAIEYEEYLKRIAEIARKVQAGQPEDTPENLNTPGKRALYNNLGENEELALQVDAKVKEVSPFGWRGVQAKERIIQAALFELLQDEALVDKIFSILKATRLGVHVNQLYIQRMKTKWGSCNPAARNIRINLDLAKKAPECLEYIILHELLHLILPNHGPRFVELMDQHMPHWRIVREKLNTAPLTNLEGTPQALCRT